jgi:hypothetical protein
MDSTRAARRIKRRGPHAPKLPLHRPLIAGLVAAALGVAASPALAIPEAEPNDTFPGQASTVTTLYDGELCLALCPAGTLPDLIDLYHYSGLTPGFAFDLTGTHLGVGDGPDFIFGRYTDQTTVVDFETAFNDNQAVHLFGVVPLSGELSFGVTGANFIFFEGYSLVLNVRQAVPEPATLALLAVGLAGALVTRRRKRS